MSAVPHDAPWPYADPHKRDIARIPRLIVPTVPKSARENKDIDSHDFGACNRPDGPQLGANRRGSVGTLRADDGVSTCRAPATRVVVRSHPAQDAEPPASER